MNNKLPLPQQYTGMDLIELGFAVTWIDGRSAIIAGRTTYRSVDDTAYMIYEAPPEIEVDAGTRYSFVSYIYQAAESGGRVEVATYEIMNSTSKPRLRLIKGGKS